MVESESNSPGRECGGGMEEASCLGSHGIDTFHG